MRRSTLVAFVLLPTVLSASAEAALILEFTFNDPGNGVNTVSTGTAAETATWYEYNATPGVLGAAVNLRTPDAGGVSGVAGDYAYDNTSTIGISGSQTQGPILLNQTYTGFNGMTSWTVSGWYYRPSSEYDPRGGHVLFQAPHPFNAGDGLSGIAFEGFAVRWDDSDSLRTNLNAAGVANSTNEWTDEDRWVFFAVAYDGTQTTDNLSYYRGFRNAAEAGANPEQVELLVTTTFNPAAGNTVFGGTGFAMGTRGPTTVASDHLNRGFDGLLDNIRVDGEFAGTGLGALTQAQLEAYRLLDAGPAGAQPIPEPGTWAFATIAFLGVGVLRRRRAAAAVGVAAN